MPPIFTDPTSVWTVADLFEKFGPILATRIRLDPPPGQATEADVLAILQKEDRLYELVDGVLVEKTMGAGESGLAIWIGQLVGVFVTEKDLGLLFGEAGTLRLMPGLIRIPDLTFVSWKKLPQRVYPEEPIPDLIPDLAVEVLSAGNTREEMKRKLKDYFLAGVRVVWYVDPRKRTVTVYTAPDKATVLTEGQTLTGGDVLPGLSLPLRQVFTYVPPAKPRPKGKRRKKGS